MSQHSSFRDYSQTLMDQRRDELIFPKRIEVNQQDQEALDVWGFKDTQFEVVNGREVVLTGNRYALCNQRLPNLIPWVEGMMQVKVDTAETVPSNYPTEIPASVLNATFVEQVKTVFSDSQISHDPETRMRHGHGHTQFEMYAVKHGKLPRIPDAVLYPDSEKQVVSLVRFAKASDVCLIPYGGGTCVTEALLCPTNEKRMIISVDMTRMNRILWIDPVNRMACIEAGAVGRHIMEQLKEYGFTLGHEPDSVEFSTMGGWVATNASGMKKNKYGNIEDIVLDVSVVTSDGTLLDRSTVAPRESVGLDPRSWIFGSEGNLGIITKTIVKVFPTPEQQEYGSLLFPTFEDGYNFMYDLSLTGRVPASIRLVDNVQFQFSMALKPKSTGMKAIKSKIEKAFVTKIKGFDPNKMVACTVVFEGTREDVALQEQTVYSLAKKHKGMKAGGDNGKKGYQLTFGIAYIRDFVMKHHVIAESFETSVPWSEALALVENVKRRINEEHDKRGLPGRPFITARLTQVYETGVCLYFYFAYYSKGVENPSDVYAELEEAARDEVLKSGGSLSHHHGIGKLRQKFLPRIKSPAMLQWNDSVKKAIDPENVFGTRNQKLGGWNQEEESQSHLKVAQS